MQTLYSVLREMITPGVKALIESEGYSVDQVVDDVMNFDMHKNREDIV